MILGMAKTVLFIVDRGVLISGCPDYIEVSSFISGHPNYIEVSSFISGCPD